MEAYKSVLKKRIFGFSFLIIFAIGLEIFNIIRVSNGNANGTFSDGAIDGFQIGLLIGLTVLFLVKVFNYILALKDGVKLQRLYNKENDERIKLIKEKSGANIIIFTSMTIIFAAIVIGGYNKVVFYSLVGCAIFLLFVSVSLKLYYSKKY